MTKMKRVPLPDTRASKTHKTTIYGQGGDTDIFITVGLYEDGHIGEVFVSVGKQGSTMRGTLDCWARMVSVALQWGIPLKEITRKFKGYAFEPGGTTTNQDIKECVSIVDYVAQWLEKESKA